MNKIWIVIILILVVAAGYFMINGSNKKTLETDQVAQTDLPSETEYTIVLFEQNESGESGEAILSEVDGKVIVTLNTVGGLAEIPQPAHIHTGECPDVGGVVYPLTNVVNGISETMLDVSLAQLAEQQPLGINVHKSVAEAKVYVACGDLALPTSPVPTSELQNSY